MFSRGEGCFEVESRGINTAGRHMVTYFGTNWSMKTWKPVEEAEQRTTENRRNRRIVHILLNTHIPTVTRRHRCTSDDFISLASCETGCCPDCVLSHVRWYLQAQRRGCRSYNRPSVGLLHQRWNWRWKTEQRLKSLLKASGKFNVHLNSYPSPPSAAQPISSWCSQSLSSRFLCWEAVIGTDRRGLAS